MWKVNGERHRLLEFGFIRDERQEMYIQNPDNFEYGGEAYINDKDDFFMVAQLCIETVDDSYYRGCHVADADDAFRIQKLIDKHMAIWL